MKKVRVFGKKKIAAKKWEVFGKSENCLKNQWKVLERNKERKECLKTIKKCLKKNEKCLKKVGRAKIILRNLNKEWEV